jgi:transposase
MAGAVRLVLDEGKTIGGVARELDLTPSSLANWVRHARADRTRGTTGLTTAEREELARLRKENRILAEERDILKKALLRSPRVQVDLIEQRMCVSRKRAVRLMREEGLQARARKPYKVTTMSDHDQAVAANVLDRRFTAEQPNQRWVGEHDRVRDRGEREALPGGGPRLVLAVHRRVGRQRRERPTRDPQSLRHGAEAAVSGRRPAPSLRPGLHLCERGLPGGARDAPHHLQHEPARQLLRRDGKLLTLPTA